MSEQPAPLNWTQLPGETSVQTRVFKWPQHLTVRQAEGVILGVPGPLVACDRAGFSGWSLSNPRRRQAAE